MTGRTTLTAVAVALLLAGCGSSTDGAATAGGSGTSRLVDRSLDPPWVTALDLEPQTGDLLLGTNRGFWRVDPESGDMSRIEGTISADGRTDTVGTFLEVEPLEPDRWLGSGHPDNQDTLPQFLGLIQTTDGGRTWEPVSRLGDADLHKIVSAHDRLYAFDAVLGAMLVSEDGGGTFDERFTPRGLVADFVVDPEDPDRIFAATDDVLYRSDDGGEHWRPVMSAIGMRLEWPRPGRIVRADQDGTVHESTDGGETFDPIGKVDGEPYKLEATDDPDHLYMATADASILETRDGGRTWKAILRP